MKLTTYLSSLLFLVSLLVMCSYSTEKDLDRKVIHPSLIYADDDTTLLGTFSFDGYKTAPYFCESLREEVKTLLDQKDKKGRYIRRKKNGQKYNLYEDELRIYTTIDPQLQAHAEAALKKHLATNLQPAFSKNNQTVKRFPFADTYNGRKVTDETIENIMRRARKSSDRYVNLKTNGYSESEIEKSFDVPVRMQLFSWKGEVDTVLTPNDSIRYAKNMIRAGLISIEPASGEVKAWVGGIDYDHFKFDHVRQGKRQIGSLIRPFTYATAFSMGVVEPCTKLSPEQYCMDPCDPSGERWCPSGTPSKTVKEGFVISSGGGTTISVMSKMGACEGPQNIADLFQKMNITIPEMQIVPSICLGTPDMSLIEITSACSIFPNGGTYVTPRTIRRIEDKHGNVIYESVKESKKVLNEIFAHDVLQLMKSTTRSGTSTSLRWHEEWGGITYPTASYAGTTQGNADMWFVGITPDLVTGIWTGGEDKQVRFRSMLWGQGARASLPIYGYYMQSVYADSSLAISTSGWDAPLNYPSERFDCNSTK
ncbi:MAG: hypothetical protein HWE22_00785 [Flavobacteriales bacterium]|nr:hypothetical protein [Flavobacteriales bacterium]